MRAWVVIMVAAAALGACGSEVASPSAATVNGKKIPRSEITIALERFEKTKGFDQLAQQSGEEAARRQFEQAYLAQQIKRAVLTPEAEALGVEVTDEELTRQLDRIKANFGSEENFRKALEERGFTLQQVADLVRDQVLEQKIRQKVTAGSAASDREARRYYRSHAEDYRQTKVQHILVKDRRLAQDIAHKLQRAAPKRVGALFAELARKNSEDSSNAKDAGKLGWVSAGDLVAPFQSAMDDLGIGAISDPVRTQFGWHVIRVTGRRVRPFDEVRDEIRSQLDSTSSASDYESWLARAYREADVEVDPRYGELDPATGQIVNATAEDVPGAGSSTPSPGSG
jgi:foldase protein PrsA